MPRANGSNRGVLEREEALAQVARLHNRGYTQKEIAEELGVSQPTIHADIVEIKRRYKEVQIEEHRALVAQKLDILREVRAEAWKAWERSKLDAMRTTEKKVPTPVPQEGKKGKRMKPQDVMPQVLRDMFTTEMTEVREGRLPASQYMTIILQTVEQERAILGLDEATKLDVHTTATLSWDDIFNKAPPRVTSREDDPIEAEIVRVSPQQLPAAK